MKFACPKYGQHIEADDNMGGMETACPTCSAPIKVPPVLSDEPKGEPPAAEAKKGNWSPGEKVPRTGTYKCIYCGPDGVQASLLKHMAKSMGIPYTPPVSSRKDPPLTFLSQGDTFPSCPNCKGDPSGADPTGWDFVSEKEVKGGTGRPGITYFECTRPPGDGTCSDDSCPCGYPGANLLRGTGYFYISKELVEMRRDALSLADIQKKLLAIQRGLGATMVTVTSGVFMPILMCQLGAKKRGIDLEVAAADAKYWWETGLAPLRPTPLAGKSSPAGSADGKTKPGCFIATACYGSPDCAPVLLLRAFRDETLHNSALGKSFIALYYRFSPAVAKWTDSHPVCRWVLRRLLIDPLVCLVRTVRSE